MKINYVMLENIGPYLEKNQFDFSTNEDNNIILIGGKNGAGKTTLLNSIKIALFGCYALGLKTESTTYYNYLKKLFNDRAILNDNSIFRLQVEFEFIQDYERAIYNIERKWEQKNNFNEEVFIKKNNIPLSNDQFEEFNEEFRSLFSPKLLDALLFDGEEVAKYFSDNLISDYLEELFTNLLNIDLLDHLDNDLLQYLNKIEKNQQDTSDFVLYKNQEQRLKNLEYEKKNVDNHYSRLKQLLEDNKLEIDSIERTFKNYGGLTEDGRSKYLSKLNSLEKNRMEATNEVKSFLENLYPLALNKKLLIQTKNQLHAEQPLKYLDQLNDLTHFLGGALQSELKSIHSHLLALKHTTPNYIHQNTHANSNSIEEIIEEYNDDKINYYQQLHQKSLDLLKEIQEIKKIIEKNENTKELVTLLERKDSLLNENKVLLEEINKAKLRLDEIVIVISKETNSLLQLQQNVETKHKENNSVTIVENILKTTDKFKEYLLDSKLHEIEELATNIFLQVNRKENYISTIQIDKNDFNLRILSPDNVVKDAEKFSAGERQLLFASILMAIIKLTELQSLMVFDTPLARLDKEHSYSFVNNIIRNAGKQVLILSTDDEIVDNLYLSLKPQIAKEYTLDYDEKNNRTFIKSGYFID